MSGRSNLTIGPYTVEGVLGSGSFATVYKAVDSRDGNTVAVKAIALNRLDAKARENLESEITILRELRHPNIVQLVDVSKSERYIYLILEYCPDGDLSALLRKHGALPEAVAKSFMRQLAAGMECLWSMNLIHRDLKPQNLLLVGRPPHATLKIADFGFARHLQVSDMAETLCGSPLYMAPEILRFEKYDAKCDLWSSGVILFEMLTGATPFTGRNPLDLLANIERTDLVIPPAFASRLSAPVQELLHALLRRNPHMRISFPEFFAHPWLQLPHSRSPASVPSLGLGVMDSGGRGSADADHAAQAVLFTPEGATPPPPPPTPSSRERPPLTPPEAAATPPTPGGPRRRRSSSSLSALSSLRKRPRSLGIFGVADEEQATTATPPTFSSRHPFAHSTHDSTSTRDSTSSSFLFSTRGGRPSFVFRADASPPPPMELPQRPEPISGAPLRVQPPPEPSGEEESRSTDDGSTPVVVGHPTPERKPESQHPPPAPATGDLPPPSEGAASAPPTVAVRAFPPLPPRRRRGKAGPPELARAARSVLDAASRRFVAAAGADTAPWSPPDELLARGPSDLTDVSQPEGSDDAGGGGGRRREDVVPHPASSPTAAGDYGYGSLNTLPLSLDLRRLHLAFAPQMFGCGPSGLYACDEGEDEVPFDPAEDEVDAPVLDFVGDNEPQGLATSWQQRMHRRSAQMAQHLFQEALALYLAGLELVHKAKTRATEGTPVHEWCQQALQIASEHARACLVRAWNESKGRAAHLPPASELILREARWRAQQAIALATLGGVSRCNADALEHRANHHLPRSGSPRSEATPSSSPPAMDRGSSDSTGAGEWMLTLRGRAYVVAREAQWLLRASGCLPTAAERDGGGLEEAHRSWIGEANDAGDAEQEQDARALKETLTWLLRELRPHACM